MKLRPSFGLRALLADRSGNVAMLFALAAIPLFIALAAAVDYARAAKVRGEMAAIADAAVLAATTPAMMGQSSTAAKVAAIKMFAAQAATVNGLTYNAANLTVAVNQNITSSAILRTVDVTYKGQMTNAFGAFISKKATNFTVTSSVTVTTAPNIDFYMLIDTSPSMELPATAAGVTFMTNATGCAFACHEKNVSDAEFSVHYPGWGTIDSYTFARNNNIPLRIDNVKDAVNRITDTAIATMASNRAKYRIGVYGFDYEFTELQSLVAADSNKLNIQKAVASLLPPMMDSNTNLAGQPDNKTIAYPTGAASWASANLSSAPVYNADAMTDFSMAIHNINTKITNPGSGTNNTSDKPQGVLMIVTDGVVDSSLYSSTGCNTKSALPYSTTINGTSYSFTRCMAPIDPSVCSTIKSRGIRIAVLYTTYQPLNGQWWYDTYIQPFISQVEPNLQSCASSPDLFSQVTTGGDIQAALDTLFKKAISTAPLITN